MNTVNTTKFLNQLNKLNIPVGFSDPKIWIDSGNFALNRLISGDYNNGVPIGKVTMFAGESGSGKSLLAANVMRNAQKKYDTFILLLDSEGAGDKKWYVNAGVNVENNFIRAPVFTVTDCTEVVSKFANEVAQTYPDRTFLVVIDSLGMLETSTGQEKFMKGKTPGDQGQLAKQLKKFVKGCVYIIEQHKNVGFLMTNHTYDSMDMFNPDQKITGGGGIIYASSIVIATRKYKLKEVSEKDEVATSTGVHGVKTTAMVYKSRFNKPFEKTTIEIPWSTGIDPYSGLVDMFETDGLLVKEGNKLRYTDKSGEEHKYFRKSIPISLLDQIMEENPYTISRDDILKAEDRSRQMDEEITDETE